MKKIGICTGYAGYNYGSALQAFATKKIIASFGFEPTIIKPINIIFKNRDIRISKLFTIFFRALFHGRLVDELKRNYSSINIDISQEKKNVFDEFYKKNLNPQSFVYSSIKREAKKSSFLAFVCGSDQIWNSESLYINPFYYLSFAPEFKRIAFAPSFGRDYIPQYNIQKIGKRVKKIPHLSCREDSGVKLLKQKYNLTAELIIDPTIILEKDEWVKLLSVRTTQAKYLVVYFLNKPNDSICELINKFIREHNFKVFNISNIKDLGFPTKHISNCGPIEFLQFISGASMVFTDSFHGTAFSLKFNTPFYVFERNYSRGSGNQSTRITSLLSKVGLLERFNNISLNCNNIDFSFSNNVLDTERRKALSYLKKCLKEISEHGE